MIGLTVDHLFCYDMHEDVDDSEEAACWRRNAAFLKALGKALKADQVLSEWMTGGTALPPEA
jgi:hypothetical protein